MEEVGVGQTGMARYKASPFWPDMNSLEWRKLVLA
jgi:hypothetical protein